MAAGLTGSGSDRGRHRRCRKPDRRRRNHRCHGCRCRRDHHFGCRCHGYRKRCDRRRSDGLDHHGGRNCRRHGLDPHRRSDGQYNRPGRRRRSCWSSRQRRHGDGGRRERRRDGRRDRRRGSFGNVWTRWFLVPQGQIDFFVLFAVNIPRVTHAGPEMIRFRQCQALIDYHRLVRPAHLDFDEIVVVHQVDWSRRGRGKRRGIYQQRRNSVVVQDVLPPDLRPYVIPTPGNDDCELLLRELGPGRQGGPGRHRTRRARAGIQPAATARRYR